MLQRTATPTSSPSHLGLILTIGLLLSTIAHAQTPFQTQPTLILHREVGDENTNDYKHYNNYRGPSLVRANDGTLIAVCEAAENGDPGNTLTTALVMRRLLPGQTGWTPREILIRHINLDGSDQLIQSNVYSNVVMVVDRTGDSNATPPIPPGRIWMHFVEWWSGAGAEDPQQSTGYTMFSDDSGATWFGTDAEKNATPPRSVNNFTPGFQGSPRNLGGWVKDWWGWESAAYGPGSGIQISSRTSVPTASQGMLIVPGHFNLSGSNPYVVYSSDHGVNWYRTNGTDHGKIGNENQIVELANGKWLAFARPNNPHLAKRRIMGEFIPTGQSYAGQPRWQYSSGDTTHSGLFAPAVHTAIERYTYEDDPNELLNRILWTGPRGPDRYDLVVRMSTSEGEQFEVERALYDGYSGYSDIALLADPTSPNSPKDTSGDVGVLFEVYNRSATRMEVFYTSFNRALLEPPAGLMAWEPFNYNDIHIDELPYDLTDKNGGIGWESGWHQTLAMAKPFVGVWQASDLQYNEGSFPLGFSGKRALTLYPDNENHSYTLARSFAQGIDMGVDQDYYVSFLLRADSKPGINERPKFRMSLCEGAAQGVGVGFTNQGYFYIDGNTHPANIKLADRTSGSFLDLGGTVQENYYHYFVVLKISANTSGTDYISMRIYGDGGYNNGNGQPIDTTEQGVAWTFQNIAAGSREDLFDRILFQIEYTSQPTRVIGDSIFLLDELRIGTTWSDVVGGP